MALPKRQVFVCTQQRPPGHPRGSCAHAGGQAVVQAFWAELQARQCWEEVGVTYSGCIGGPCDAGPNAVVYPEGVVYSGLQPEDVRRIFEEHLIGGTPVTQFLGK